MSVKLPQYPQTPSLMGIEDTQALRILRKIKTGRDEMGDLITGWQEVAVVPGTIHAKSGVLRMTSPGQIAWGAYTLLTDFMLDDDGFYIVRPRDIVVDEMDRTYLVRFVNDEGDAHQQLVGDLEHGTLQHLRGLAEQS